MSCNNNICESCGNHKDLYYSLRGFLPYDCYRRYTLYLCGKCFEQMNIEINKTNYYPISSVYLLVTSWTRLPAQVNLF